MSASSLDKFKKVGFSTATSLGAPGHLIGGTSITVGSTTNWPTSTGVTFAIDRVELVGGEEVQVAGSYTLWQGTVTGATTIANMSLHANSPNSDQNYSAGSLTRVYIPISAGLHNDVMDGILTHADQDGTLKADAVDVTAVIKDNVVSNAKLSEFKPAEVMNDFVYSGGVVAQSAGLVGTFSNMVHYINGVRCTKTSVANKTYTASKDTYVDADATNNATVVYTEVANGAASPALTAGYIRVAIVTTNGSAITSVNQGQTTATAPTVSSAVLTVSDSLGNRIYPAQNQRVLATRGNAGDFSSTAVGSNVDVTGMSCQVIAPAGKRLKITAVNRNAQGNGIFQTLIVENSTQIAAALVNGTVTMTTVVSAATANPTYKVAIMQSSAGTMLWRSDGELIVEEM